MPKKPEPALVSALREDLLPYQLGSKMLFLMEYLNPYIEVFPFRKRLHMVTGPCSCREGPKSVGPLEKREFQIKPSPGSTATCWRQLQEGHQGPTCFKTQIEIFIGKDLAVESHRERRGM